MTLESIDPTDETRIARYEDSGYGRELGPFGIRAITNAKPSGVLEAASRITAAGADNGRGPEPTPTGPPGEPSPAPVKEPPDHGRPPVEPPPRDRDRPIEDPPSRDRSPKRVLENGTCPPSAPRLELHAAGVWNGKGWGASSVDAEQAGCERSRRA